LSEKQRMVKSEGSGSFAGWRKKNPAVVFVGLFALQIILFYLVYFNHWFQIHVFDHWVSVYCQLSVKLLHLFGQEAFVSGDRIYSALFSVEIRKGCDAVEPMALFAAGIFAFPAPPMKKLYGLLFGLTVIFVINILRIDSLVLISIHHPDLFDMIHLEVWQVIFIVLAITIWYFWLRWTRKTVSAS
jgi:exosortase/archaeosortase family protein